MNDKYESTPLVIATIAHYDDRLNIHKYLNRHLLSVVDAVIILYSRVEGYPSLTTEQEEREIKLLTEHLEKFCIPFIINVNEPLPEGSYKTFKTREDQINHLLSNTMIFIKQNIKNMSLDYTNKDNIWLIRIDSDEIVTKELADELNILKYLDYLYTVFIPELHYVSKDEVIIGSDGWDIVGNKFFPRMFKVWTGSHSLIPNTPTHHINTSALHPQTAKNVPYSNLPRVTTVEPLIHIGHTSSKKKIRKKAKSYRREGFYDGYKKDNYFPIQTEHEMRLREWFKDHTFEGICKNVEARKV